MNRRLLLESTKAWRCRNEWNVAAFCFRYFASSSKASTSSSRAKVDSIVSSEARKSIKPAAGEASKPKPPAKTKGKQGETGTRTKQSDIAEVKGKQASKKTEIKVTEEGLKKAPKKAEPKSKQEQNVKTMTRRSLKKITEPEGGTPKDGQAKIADELLDAECSARRAQGPENENVPLLEAPKKDETDSMKVAVELVKRTETTEEVDGVEESAKSTSVKEQEETNRESGSAMRDAASEAEQERDENAKAVENDKDFQGVDEELKEFLQLRKEQKEKEQGEDDDDDLEYDCEWDYREVRHLPDNVNVLEKRLKELAATAPQGDRRTAMVKLKLALELCKTDDSSHAQRAVDLANEALKVLGIGANDYSMEQGICLSALGAGYRKLEQKERSLSYLKRALRYFDEKEEKGIEVVRERQFVLNELGLTYFSMGNVKQGTESLSESLELLETFLELDDPLLGDEFRKAAAHLCDVNEWTEAKKQCEKAIKVHSRSRGYDNEDVGQDRKIMTRIYRGLNQHEQALEQFRIARQIFSEDKDNVYWANMGIADSQLALGSISEAIATLEGTINAAPKKPPTLRGAAYLKLSKAFYLKENHEQARKRLSEALEFYKENISAASLQEIASQLHEVAALFDAMGDVKGSIRTLRLAIAAYDCIPGGEAMLINAKMDLGSQLISHGEASAALGCYNQALALAESLNKVSPNLLTLTAIANMTIENHDAAVQLLERAAASLDHPLRKQVANKEGPVEPGFVRLPVYQNLARCYRALSRFKDALKYQKLVVAELRMLGGETEERRIHDAVRMMEELSEQVEEMSEKVNVISVP